MDRQNENTGFAKRAYTPMDDAEIFRAAERMMSGDKVFLDPHLTMEALADRIGTLKFSASRTASQACLHLSEAQPVFWKCRANKSKQLVAKSFPKALQQEV